jgi:hypothetical protein
MAIRRVTAQWRTLLTVLAGVLLSAAVGALIPLYTTAVAQVSLIERLNRLPPDETNAAASLALIPSAAEPAGLLSTTESYSDLVHDIATRYLGTPFPGWLHDVLFFGETSALSINQPAITPEPGAAPRIPDPTTRVFVAYYEGWTDAVSLIAGRPPADLPPADPAADIEIVVPFEAQVALGISTNDVLELDQGGPRGGWASSRNVRARVVGIAAPPESTAALARAYFMAPAPLRFVEPGGEFTAELVVLTTRTAFEQVAVDFIPDTPARVGWRLRFDHTRLPFSRSPEARAALHDFATALADAFRAAPSPLTYRTQLVDRQIQGGQPVDQGILLDYERSIRSLDAPFGLLLLQVGALVLFFLIVTAALVRRGERREIAMLQSRGAPDRSLLIIRGVEALLICAAGAALAPLIAQRVLIAITPFFADYPDLPLLLTPEVFAFAALSSGGAFLALMATLRPVLRLPLISAGGQAIRSERQPWWQRYYVDVIVAVLGAAALLRLAGRDTPLFSTAGGGAATDPFLLLAPAFLFLGLGSVLLRLFPALGSAAARILSAGSGLTGPLAAWQISREPLHYGRITFLLALAIGIGWFATSFQATVNRSHVDQAQYRVGTDVRFAERDLRLNAARARPESTYAVLPGVENATVAWRRANLNFQSIPSRPAVLTTLLGVDPTAFQTAAHWRPDLGTLAVPVPPSPAIPERGAPLPITPERLGLWARIDVLGAFGAHVPDLDRLRHRTTLYVRLLDAGGAWIIAPFEVAEIEYTTTGPQAPGLGGGGAFVANGWAYLEADLSTLDYRPAEPVRLVSLFWNHRGRSQGGERFLRLTLAGLTAIAPDGTPHGLTLLSEPGWAFAYDSGALSEGAVTVGVADPRHGRGLVAAWDQSAETGRAGLLLNYPAFGPLPALASTGLLGQLGVMPGQTIEVRNVEGVPLTIRLEGVAQAYYPTLYDATPTDTGWAADSERQAFAIADRDSLLYMLNRRPGAAVYADEVWLKAEPGSDALALLLNAHPSDGSAALLRAQTLPGALEALHTDPLSRGLLGLMLLAFIVAMALSVVGLLTYAALTAAARRAEFGVLRALGLSPAQVIAQLTLEQLFIIGLAVALGAILGVLLSSQVVPRLAQDASGAQITPPFLVQIETEALLQYGALIAGVIALLLIASLLIVRQLSLTRTLRLGED